MPPPRYRYFRYMTTIAVFFCFSLAFSSPKAVKSQKHFHADVRLLAIPFLLEIYSYRTLVPTSNSDNKKAECEEQ